jgi:hypothetical protein
MTSSHRVLRPWTRAAIAGIAAAVTLALVTIGCAASDVTGTGSRAGTVVGGAAGGSAAGDTSTGPDSGGTSSGPITTTGTAIRPAKVNGPSRGAVPMVTVTDYPGYFCSARGTLVPAIVVYDDGNVLTADGIGASCEKVPNISAGWIDPASVRARLDEYFKSPDSKVDMSNLPVTDLGSTGVQYVGTDGAVQKVGAYGLGFDSGGSGIPADQVAARAALGKLLRFLAVDSGPKVAWAPQQLSVIRSSPGEFANPSKGPVAWPLRSTTASAKFFRTSPGCLPVTGKDAAIVLRAHGSRHTQAIWTVGGKEI